MFGVVHTEILYKHAFKNFQAVDNDVDTYLNMMNMIMIHNMNTLFFKYMCVRDQGMTKTWMLHYIVNTERQHAGFVKDY